MDIELQVFHSRIVLGYIHNSSRRFYTYVANQVARIRSSTELKQWQYVLTDENPADHGTQVTCLVTEVTEQSLGATRFERFSVWKSLVRGMANLVHVAKTFSRESQTDRCKGWHQCGQSLTTERSQAKVHIFKAVQEASNSLPESPCKA